MMSRPRSLTDAEKDLGAVLILFALSGLFFANVLLTDQVLVGDTLARYIPWNFYVDPQSQPPVNYEFDTLLAYYPQIVVARETLQNGQLPLWNPYFLSGIPLLAAAPWLGLFYPPYALFYVTDPLEAIGYVSCLQLGLGGLFMYLYLRGIQVRRLAALFGAASFGLGGFMLANLTWLPRVSTVIWMPLLLFSFEKCLQREAWLYAVLGGFAVAMCILAGNMAAAVYVLLAAGLYALFRLAWAWRRDGGKLVARYALAMGGAVCMGVLLSAVQMVPTVEVARYAGRVHVEYDERIEGGRSPLALATAIVPDVFGNPVDRPWGRNVFAKNIPGTYGETSLYVGIVPLVLAVWAVARRRDSFTVFYCFLALLSLIIFVDTPLFRVLYQLPLFRVGRQVEAKAMWGLATSALAALGLAALLDRPLNLEKRTMRRAAAGLMAMAVLVAMGVALAAIHSGGDGAPGASAVPQDWYRYNIGNFLRLGLLLLGCAVVFLVRAQGRVKPRVLTLLVLGITLADLAWFGWKLHPSRSPEGLYPEMESVRFLQGDESIYRTIRGPLSRKVFPANSLAVYGISDVQGYSPVLIDYYVEFLQLIEEDIASSRMVHSLKYPESTVSPLLDLLNAKYVVTMAEPGEEMANLERAEPNLELVHDGEVKIYENLDALPRAFFVPGHIVAANSDQLLEELSADGFDPSAIVILEEEPAGLAPSSETASMESYVEVVDYTSNRVVVQAALSAPGFVVLSDLYYEGWKAFVDGTEHKVLRADHILRAVQLEAGEHRIEFVFDPLSFKVGSAVTLATLLLAGVVTALLLWRRGRE
jgi:hypothetical protein